MTSLLTSSTLAVLLAVAPDEGAPPPDSTAASDGADPGTADPDSTPDSTPDTADPGAESTGQPAEGSLAPSPAPGQPGSDGEAPDADPEEAGEGASTEISAPLDSPPPVPVAAPPPKVHTPRPIRWRLDFGVHFGSTLVSDLGYRAFNDRRHLPEANTSVMFDFRLAEGRFFLGGGLGYQRLGRNDGLAYNQLGTEVDLHEPEVIGRLSFMAIEGVDAFARFGVGPSIVDFNFYSNDNAQQRSVIPRVDAQAGLSLYLPKPWLARKRASRVTAGIDLGLGYTWRGTIAAQPDLVQDDEPLRATTSPWGDLSLQGLSWRVGLFVRVM